MVRKDLSISLKGVSKIYSKRESNTTALKDVSIDFKKGSRVGITGKNGSGKSTLLKIIGGIIKPTQGSIKVQGSLMSITDLTGNFINELTGNENAKVWYSLNKENIYNQKAFLQGVEEYAELGIFFNQPVKNFSSGMLLRLGFACFAKTDADILLLDEVISTGDIYFQKKIADFFEQKINENKTILMVSHSPTELSKFCDQCIILESGSIEREGNIEDVLGYYVTTAAKKNSENNFNHPFSMQTQSVLKLEFRNVENNFILIDSFSVLASPPFTKETPLLFDIKLYKKHPGFSLIPAIYIYDYLNESVLALAPEGVAEEFQKFDDIVNYVGYLNIQCIMPSGLLSPGIYTAELRLGKNVKSTNLYNEELLLLEEKLRFRIDKGKTIDYFGGTQRFCVQPQTQWRVENLNN